MEFKKVSVDGVLPPDGYKTRASELIITGSTATTYFSQQRNFNITNTAPINKTVPVNILDNDSTVTSVTFGPDDTWTTVYSTKWLGTGSHSISATWPGEGRYAEQLKSATVEFNILPGYDIVDTLNCAVGPVVDLGDGRVVRDEAFKYQATWSHIGTNTNVPDLTGGTAIFYSSLYKPYPNASLEQQAPINTVWTGTTATVNIISTYSGPGLVRAYFPGQLINVPVLGETFFIEETSAGGDISFTIHDRHLLNSTATLISNTSTNVVTSSTRFTMTLNTSTLFNGTSDGEVYFYRDGDAENPASGTYLGKGTLTNNVASLTIDPTQLTVGSHTIRGYWLGRDSYLPRYESIGSNIKTQVTVPRGSTTATIALAPTVFRRYSIKDNALFTNTAVTATIYVKGIYPTHEPTGLVKLYDGATFLGEASLNELYGTSSSTTSVVWNPATAIQLDKGSRTITAQYQADYWNTATSVQTSNFIAYTKGLLPNMTLVTTSATVTRPVAVNLKVNVPTTYYVGKTVGIYEGSTLITSTELTSTSTSVSISSMNLTTGTHNFYAFCAADTYFESTTSNTIVQNIVKRQPSVPSITFYSTVTISNPATLTVQSDITYGVPTGHVTLSVTSSTAYEYVITPTTVFSGPGEFWLNFTSTSTEVIRDINYINRAQIFFNGNLVTIGTGTTYARVVNQYDEFNRHLELWGDYPTPHKYSNEDMGTTALSTSWPTLSTGTVTVRWNKSTATTVGTVLDIDTENSAGRAVLTNNMTPGLYTVKAAIAEDDIYLSTSTNTVSFVRKPNKPAWTTVDCFMNNSNAQLSWNLTPNLIDIPTDLCPNRAITMKVYYRWIAASSWTSGLTTGFVRGNNFGNFDYALNSTESAYFNGTGSINFPAWPAGDLSVFEVTADGTTYVVDGFYFELVYQGGASVPAAKTITGYITTNFGHAQTKYIDTLLDQDV